MHAHDYEYVDVDVDVDVWSRELLVLGSTWVAST